MITLLNPRSARWKFRLPLSILSLGAELEGRYPYEIVDGNFESDAETVLAQRMEASDARYLAITVMPGPQLGQAIPLTESFRRRFPDLVIVWGGYFPSLHTDVVLESGLVDYVIRGPGATSFRKLIDALEAGDSLEAVPGLSYRSGGTLVHNPGLGRDRVEAERPIPYHRIDVDRYVSDTCLGSRTLSYHSSYGCPFLCGFCAVAGVYKGAWSGRSPEEVARDVEALHRNHGINAVEFIDNNFFVGEQRTAEIAERIAPLGLGWWGEARPDTVMGYSDSTWRTMADSGLKMMFFGVESSSSDVLESMDKGGTQTPEMVLDLAARSLRFGIVPEFSFVLGTPSKDVGRSIGEDIRYIRKIKAINPASEIIIYVYSPVSFEDAGLFRKARASGFRFPERLEDWLKPEWNEFDLRRDPKTPWLGPSDVRRIRDFEWVLNARYPTISDIKLRAWQVLAMKTLGLWRYRARFYAAPYEIRFVANRLFRYRQPEVEGF